VNGIIYPSFPYQYFPGGMTDVSENGRWHKTTDRTVTTLFTQATIDLKEIFSLEKGVKNWAVTIGGRYDHYDDVGSSTNPRFGMV